MIIIMVSACFFLFSIVKMAFQQIYETAATTSSSFAVGY